MQRPCDICGGVYEAKRPTSKYCSSRCRTRASRGAQPVTALPRTPLVGPVEAAAIGQLQSVERDGTVLGQTVLALARRLDLGVDTGAGLASLARQLDAALKSATVDVRAGNSPVDQMKDELAARRAQRGA